MNWTAQEKSKHKTNARKTLSENLPKFGFTLAYGDFYTPSMIWERNPHDRSELNKLRKRLF